jgi:hypothetical protein
MQIDLSSLINIEPMSLRFGNDVYTSSIDVYTAAARIREAYKKIGENPETKDDDEAAVKMLAQFFEASGINVPESIASTVAIHLVAQAIMKSEEEAKKTHFRLCGATPNRRKSRPLLPRFTHNDVPGHMAFAGDSRWANTDPGDRTETVRRVLFGRWRKGRVEENHRIG